MKEYIGVLDSGVGGLSVLSQLKNLMPNQNYIYFGDTKNVPYGTKSKEEIYKFTKAILNFFITKNVKNVVFACNTTSAVAYDELKRDFYNKLNIFPLIQTVAYSAQKGLKDNDIIAILATRATTQSKKYTQQLQQYNKNLLVKEIDCTGFVEIVENCLYEDSSSIELIKSKLELIKDAKRVVLGCTHYPYLTNIFKSILDKDYFNPAICLAKIVKEKITKEKTASLQEVNGEVLFYVSKNPEGFKNSGKVFFDIKDEVRLISL